MIRVTLCGALGRMGREISRAIAEADDLQLVLKVDHDRQDAREGSADDVPLVVDLDAHFTGCDVIVDFTAPEGATRHARVAAARGVPFVSGTTGLSTEQQAVLRAAGERVPVLFASNMSLGITMACTLLQTAARELPPAYDVEILEMHHRRKQDAPSGTALKLAEVVREARTGLRLVHGRQGETGRRLPDELGLHALRGGDVVGEHQVIFAGPGERLIIKHVADSRQAFVAGTLAGIRYLVGCAPGLYGMADVLGGRRKS